MKKYLLINVLRYICILFVFALGFITIIGSNGGGGSDDFDLGFQWDTNPHTPTNLVATAVTSIKINLSWTASKNADEYVIYRNGAYLKTVGKSQGPPTSDKWCNPASRYCYTVKACKDFFFSQSCSPKSKQACATTLPDTPPTVPTNLTANAVTSTQLDLSWDASTGEFGVTGYNIYRDGSYLKTVSGTSASDSGLTPITDYCYTVSAYYAPGNDSTKSDQVCATTLPDIPPSIPTNLVATSVNPAQIDLSWDASTDDYGVTGYNIYRDGTYLESVTETSVSDTGLNPVTNYCYAVSAYDAVGNESAQSPQVCEATPPDLTPPTVPGNLALISVPPDQIDLEWDPSSDDGIVVGYNIYRNGVYLKSVLGTSASDTVATKFTPQCYEVSAYDAAGNESAPGSQICAMAWSITTMEDSQRGGYPSIAIDSADKVHISYIAGDLKYATNVSGVWVTETIDSQGRVVRYPSIAIDSADKVHISYYDYSYHNLKYATNASGVWVTDTIDSQGRVGRYPSIAIDSADKVHISYSDEYTHDLKYATNVSGVWVTDTIDGQGYVGSYNSIALDTADNVHISYSDVGNKALKYITNVSGTWVTDTIGSQAYLESHNSIALDSTDNVHISYRNYHLTNLKYATNASGVWVTDTIDSQGRVGSYNSITLDSADNVHISYYDYSYHNLKYATNVSGVWDTYIILGKEGGSTSIAVDSSDYILIVFTSGGINYAINR